jgi:3-phosphoshikimate 1-carboxyvinyltransferase
MYNFQLNNRFIKVSIFIHGSKSESNRLLILNNIINIDNFSNSEDTQLVKKSLKFSKKIIYINNSGTAIRFLTSYFSVINISIIIYGYKRMQYRPIGPLVYALKSLGINIEYIQNVGFPPIKIIGKEVLGCSIYIDACISSQYMSSLMLLTNKLKIFFNNKIISEPYLYMTFKLMIINGINVIWINREIYILNVNNNLKNYLIVESDWSSASYYYALATFSKELNLKISSYKYDSIQGDQVLIDIYDSYFGIKTFFESNSIRLYKNTTHNFPYYFKCNLNYSPDIAQPIAVNSAVLKIKCILTGLDTLTIKETDRLQALQNELINFGIITNITDNIIGIIGFNIRNNYNVLIKTYEDHRMAMSFSIISMLYTIYILNPVIVNKSYPNFWNHIKYLGISFLAHSSIG